MQEATGPERVHLAYLGNGGSYHVHTWLPALARQGLRVTLLSYHPPSHPLDGVAVQPLRPPFHASPEALSWVDFCGPTRPLRRLLARLEVDVLMPSVATSYGWLAARSGFRPLLLNTWTYDVSVYPFEGWRRWLFRPLVTYVLRRADTILTDGGALAELVRTRYALPREKVVPVLWGPDLAALPLSPSLRPAARARWGLPPGAPVVLSARGVADWYGPAQALPALLRLLDVCPNVHVVVLTLAHERTAATQRRLEALAAHPRARVVDRFLSRKEMAAAWAAADVLVSVPPHDGISVGVLEGMYAGVLPVVSDIPSNRAILEEDRGFFVPPGDVEALVRTLRHVVEALPRLRPTLAPRNRAWVQDHASVEAAAGTVAALARRLAAAAPVRRQATPAG